MAISSTFDVTAGSFDTEKFVTGLVQQLLPKLKPLVEEKGQEIVADITSDWPVDTGLSKESWEAAVASVSEGVTLTVRNPVEYVPFVHPKGGPTGQSLSRAMRRTRKGIEALEAEIAATVERSLKGS